MRALPKPAYNRRHFMRALASASAAATVVAVPVSKAEAYDPGEEETQTRYRETEHVQAFYRTNGYEGRKK